MGERRRETSAEGKKGRKKMEWRKDEEVAAAGDFSWRGVWRE